MVGVTPLFVAIMAPFWGLLADRHGAKPIVLRALGFISLVALGVALAPNVAWVLGLRLILGFVGGFTPMAIALAVSAGPRERLGQAMGLIQAAQFLPLAVGPPLGGLVSDHFGLRANFAVSSIVAALSAVLLAVLFREEAPVEPAGGEKRERGGYRGSYLAILALPGFAATMVVLFVAQFNERSLTPILPLYLSSIDTPQAQLATVTGLVISAGAIASASSATIYGRLARPGKTRRNLLIALGAGAVCMAPLALTQRWEQVLALRLLLGFLAGGAVGLIFTLGARMAPPDKAGLAVGILTSFSGMAFAVSPVVSGLVGRQNLRAVFLLSAGLYVLALVLVVSLLRRADKASDQEQSPS